MKKLLSTFAVVALLATTPALAGDRDRDRNGYSHSQREYIKDRRKEQRRHAKEHRRYDRYQQHRYDRYERSHYRNSNGVTVSILAGVVLGSLLNDGSRYNRYYYNDVRSERNCFEMRHIDRYGRVISTYDCR